MSFLEQLNQNKNIGYFQFKENIGLMHVYLHGREFLLKVCPCEIKLDEENSDICVLIILEPVWMEF